jgi:transposase
VKADFIYNESTDSFTCPAGQELRVVSRNKRDRVYRGEAAVCAQCEYQPRCCQSNKGAARSITTDNKEAIRQRMNVKMRQAESKAVYKDRKIIVEPVFGQIKTSGFRGFSVRGKDKVSGEFSLVCAVHNIKKTIKSVVMGQLRPQFDNRLMVET